MEGKLIERSCPACNSSASTLVVRVKMRDVLRINRTYDEQWFTVDTIDPDFPFPIERCKDCQFVYSKYTIEDSLLFRYYNESIIAERSRQKIYRHQKRKMLIDIWARLSDLKEQDEVNVLDYGAGWGDFLAVAESHGVTVTGLEFDERKIKFAQKHGINLGNFDLVQKYAPYDVFMCNQVLEHLNDPLGALKMLRYLLKPGAVGFVAVPNFIDSHLTKQIRILQSGGEIIKDLDPVGHINYFTPDSLCNMIKKAGYEIVDDMSKPSGFLNRLRRQRNISVGTNIFVQISK